MILRSALAVYLSLILALPQLALPRVAYADGPTDNTLNFDANKVDQGQVDCDDFCGKLVGGGGDWQGSGFMGRQAPNRRENAGKVYTPSGGPGPWGPADHLWCAIHGVQTDPTISANTPIGADGNPNPQGSPSPQPSLAPDNSCNVHMFANENCQAVNDGLTRCKFYNGQVINQCMAYEATDQSAWLDGIIMVLDLAATVSCAIACFDPTQAAGTWCTYVGLIAGLSEMAATIAQSQSPTGMLVGNLLGATGAGLSIAHGVSTGTFTKFDDVEKTTEQGMEKGKTSKDYDKMACVEAIVFAVMAGIRAYNIATMGNAKSDACTAVQKSASKATVMSNTPTANPNNSNFHPTNGGGNTNGNGGGGGSINGPNSGSNSSSNTAGNNGSTSSPSLACAQSNNGLGGCGAAATAGKDGEFLSRTGMDKSVMPLAQNIAQGIGHHPDAGAALAGALGGAAGDFGNSLAQVAAAAQKDPPQIDGMAPAAAAYAGGGGGGGGSRGTAGGGSSPFGGMFGGAPGAAQGATAQAAFGQAAPQMDIWHTGTHLNLFEIVSDKLGKVSPRVSAK